MTAASQVRGTGVPRLARRLAKAASAVGVVGWLALATGPVRAQEAAPIQALAKMRVLLGQAGALQRQGQTNEALTLATEAIRIAPDATEARMFRGQLRAANGAFREAAGDFAKVIELQPGNADARLQRALARFREGRLTRALEDFDRLAQMAPRRMPELWQWGVALSLAGRHDDARRQFEAHRQINRNDVEVATWHFLSVAKLEGFEAARMKLIPVTGDDRVPMAEIWRLYAGQGSPNAVSDAAETVEEGPARTAARFYARLYLAMYLDAAGKTEEARSASAEAARLSMSYDFLGQAARLYAGQLEARAATNAPAPPAPDRKLE